jgi:hypothetical protein
VETEASAKRKRKRHDKPPQRRLHSIPHASIILDQSIRQTYKDIENGLLVAVRSGVRTTRVTDESISARIASMPRISEAPLTFPVKRAG